jgi:uncharacterized phage protein gp47/JayE
MAPGAKARALAEAYGERHGEIIDKLKIGQVANLLGYAEGDFLDALGEILGVPRLSEETNYVDENSRVVRLYTLMENFGEINEGSPIVIPALTELFTSPADGTSIIYFETIEAVTLQAADNEAFISVRAKVAGSSTNIGEGELNNINFSGYSDSVNQSLQVTNESPINSGRERESDSNYRFRISQQAANLAKANEMAVRLAALQVPGVADIRLTRWQRGIGTADIIVQATTLTVSNALLALVSGAVREAEGIGNYVYVRRPTEIGVKIEISLKYRNNLKASVRADIQTRVAVAIREYINNLPIGEGYVINEIVQRVLDVDDNIKDIGTTGQPIDNIYLYRYSAIEESKVPRRVEGNYLALIDEKLIMEPSIDDALVIRSI